MQAVRRPGARGYCAMALLVGLIAASCGSSNQADSDTGAGSGTTAGSGPAVTTTLPSSRDGVDAARSRLDEFSQPRPDWAPVGEPFTGAETLGGGTVWHIQIDASIPAFQPVIAGLNDAFDEIGVTVQDCDAKFTPTGATECYDQAIRAGAAAIITNGVPDEFVGAAQERAADAGIPVVIGANPYGDEPATKLRANVDINHVLELSLVADWVISDSDGSAEILVIELNDSETSNVPVQEGFVGTIEEDCPDCTVHVIQTQYTSLPNLGPQVSAALTQYPDVTYVIPQYDGIVNAVLPGLQSSGKINQVKGAAGSATTSGLQMVKDGNFLHAIVGSSQYVYAWVEADQAIRMMLDLEPVQRPEVVQRAFTAANIDSIEISSQAEASGDWFGIDDVAAIFRAQWGLGG